MGMQQYKVDVEGEEVRL